MMKMSTRNMSKIAYNISKFLWVMFHKILLEQFLLCYCIENFMFDNDNTSNLGFSIINSTT